MSKEKSYGTIAAMNAFFGVINFIVLSLPEGWKLISSKIPPEINRILRRGNVKWALEGYAVSYVINPNIVAEVEVRVLEGNHFRDLGEKFTVNGHLASYRIRKIKKGFLKRREIYTLNISFYCDDTNRTFMLSFSAQNVNEYVNDILIAIPNSICH